MSAANLVGASIVLLGLKEITPQKAEQWPDDFMKAASIRIESVTPDQEQAGRSAHLQFGKATGRSAALNYGDCLAYALAKSDGRAAVVQRERLSVDGHSYCVNPTTPAPHSP